MRRTIAFILLLFALTTAPAHSAEPQQSVQVGLAKIDITPTGPIRLSGYAARSTESTEVEQPLWVKAVAIRSPGPDGSPELAVLLSIDNCAVPKAIRDQISKRLASKFKLNDKRFAMTFSHTHSAPCLTGAIPYLFVRDLPEDEIDRIDQYTERLINESVTCVGEAIDDLAPANLSFSMGSATFAKNRRTEGGPVDHSLPVLRITTPSGELRGLVANYACHCTTLGGEFNKVCGDWATYAQDYLEQNHPSVIALVTIGSGADSNPHPRGSLDLARRHGREISDSIEHLLENEWRHVQGPLVVLSETVQLPFGPHFTEEKLEERAQQNGIVGFHAKKLIEQRAEGKAPAATLPYWIQTWSFGSDLAMVFLPGEVVVDYALELKNRLDPDRLWITAYANDAPCYIPSKRILHEGGYEAEHSLWYYGQPARLSPQVEEIILQSIVNQLPAAFRRPEPGAPLPKDPQASLRSIVAHPDLKVELAAFEPVVIDPVAIDFALDGSIWVAEMRDYPAGVDGDYAPGGVVKRLRDLDADGVFETATVFVSGLPFPTDLMAWTDSSILICAAPDILLAEDTDGDGAADKVEPVFSGFATHNYQARVNSLRLGLDNWIYGAGGLFGGDITINATGERVSVNNRDFRFTPDLKRFEGASGRSQQGRVRNDFNDWFGCDNSSLIRHYPLAEHYLIRNPTAALIAGAVYPPAAEADPHQLFPISHGLARFNDPAHAGRVTSACGLELYRDTLLGGEFSGDAFVCEPVHNLVHRLKLIPDGLSYQAHRPEEESEREFLASTDLWFRPVQVRPGPDGALWIVDMYRYVIEHPRWIQPDRLATIDVRAGDMMGRIYRVRAEANPLRNWERSSRQDTAALIRNLTSSSGTLRDMAHMALIAKARDSTKPLNESQIGEIAHAMRAVAQNGVGAHPTIPSVRAQALAVLAALNQLTWRDVEAGLEDIDSRVRKVALLHAEPFLSRMDTLPASVAAMANDPDLAVQLQLALSAGESPAPEAKQLLEQLASRHSDNEWIQKAVLSARTGAPIHSAIPPRTTNTLASRKPNPPSSIPAAADLTHGDLSRYFIPGREANLERGRDLFKVACASCHLFNGDGIAFGPDLAALSDRSPAALLFSILRPSAAIDPKFIAYKITLTNGDDLLGVVIEESAAALNIREGSGALRVIARSDIEGINESRLSIMPEGFGESMSPEDLTDLIRYLGANTAAQPLSKTP